LLLLKSHIALLIVCMLVLLISIANNYFGFFIVSISIQRFGLSEPTAVMLLTTQGLVFIGTLFSMGSFAEWLGYFKFYLTGLSLIGSGLLLLALSSISFWLWPASPMLGLGLGLLHI